MVTGTALTLSLPASASLSACNSGNVCIWGNNDFEWLIGERSGGQAEIRNFSGDANNANDSWANKSTFYGAAYDGFNGTGECSELAQYSTDNNIGFYDADDWSSWRTKYGC